MICLSGLTGDEESNILRWKFAMKYALLAKKLWYLIEDDGSKIEETQRANDKNTLISFLLQNIHEEKIGTIMGISEPKLMWEELQSSHLLNSSGSRYYHLRKLMNLPVASDDGIKEHLMQINSIGTSLHKLSNNGMIAVEDIKVAALLSLLPSEYNSTTAPFERMTDVRYKSVSDAVRGAVMTNRNRSTNTVSSTASVAQTTGSSSRFKGKKKIDNEKNDRSNPSLDRPRCDHCRSTYHKAENCIKK